MSKTSSAVKDRWNRKNYDNITMRVPKGCKGLVEAYTAARGESVNGLLNKLLRTELGLTEDQWRVGSTGDEK